MTSGKALQVPATLRKGGHAAEDSIRSARWLIDHMCAHLGLRDLRDTELLDYGCGTKFTEALLAQSLPIKRYVGLDADGEMIAFLRENVDDPRFEYFHVDARNELYNPGGQALSNDTRLPVEGRTFDAICLFSVFTHVAPDDYATLLRLLRRHAARGTQLFYTLYIDELTPGGHGLMDVFARRLGHTGPPEDYVPQHTAATGFFDADPAQPLLWAVYSESRARELVEGTGWEIVELSRPERFIQHHFVLRAVEG